MSHGGEWRGLCEGTGRDTYRNWLYRIVRPLRFGNPLRIGSFGSIHGLDFGFWSSCGKMIFRNRLFLNASPPADGYRSRMRIITGRALRGVGLRPGYVIS